MIDDKLQQYLTWFKSSQVWRSDFIEKHKEYYKLYKSVIDESKLRYTHKVFVPYTYAMIEDFYAKLGLSIYVEDTKFFNVKLRGVNPPFKNTQRLIADLEEILDAFVRHEESDFFLEITTGLKHLLMYSIACNCCYPTFHGDKLHHMVFDHIPFSHFFPQPEVTSPKKMRWAIIRTMEHFDTILEKQAKGMYEGVEEDDWQTPKDDEWEEFLKGLGFKPDSPYIHDEKNKRVELLDIFFADGNVITILGRKKIIRDTTKDELPPLDGFPFILYKGSGAPDDEFLGVSLIEAIKPLQEDINLIRSQRRENVSLILNKLFIASKFADIEFDTLFSAPGNVILAGDINGIRDFPMSDTATSSAFREEQNLYLDMQNASGSTELVRGMAPRRRETATAIMTQQKMAQSRFEWFLKLVDLQLFKPMAHKILHYVKKYIDEDTYTAICGTDNAFQDFIMLRDSDFKSYFYVATQTNVLTRAKEVERQQFMQIVPFLFKLPNINHLALVRRLLMMFDMKNIDEIIPALKASPETREIGEEIEAGRKQGLEALTKKLLAGGKMP